VRKCNPDVIIRVAVQLAKVHGLDGKTFNAAMRKEFPRIGVRALRKAHQDAKILIAIEQVTEELEPE
jgi:hypothetical protein